MPDTLWARLSGPPFQLLPPSSLPIWSRLAHEHGRHSIDFPDVSDLRVIKRAENKETRFNTETPMQFEVKIALTKNRGYERKGRRRSKQRQRARRPSQPMHAHSPAATDRQHSLQPPKSKQASKRRKGKREDGRAENVDHYRRKLASDGRNDGRTEEGRTPRGRWAQVRRNCRRRCLRGRASAKLAFSDQMQH